MLYASWRQVARRCPDELALSEAVSGRRWTFRELAAAAEREPLAGERVVFPRGAGAEFVLTVLRAWEAGKVVCPLELGQPPPLLRGDLPAGTGHLKTTSATTGSPRLVAFAQDQLKADADNIVATMGLRPDWPNLGVISLAHSYGFSNLVLPLLLHGIPLVLVGAALPEAIREVAARHASVTLAAVPALWQTWLGAGAIPSNVRLAISAGAPLPLALEHRVFAECGIKLHNFYGSTECGGIAFDSTPVPRPEAARVGAPLANVQLSIGKNGCVEVRGPAVGLGYWPKADRKLQGGVFRTSDLAELCGGQVYLRGRITDQINVAGRKVLPEVIEGVLATHPQVRACLAFGVPSSDSHRGEKIVACVAGSLDLTSEVLRQFAMARLPAWQVPRDWWMVEALETNGRGKLSRADWRERYLERCATGKGRH